MARYPEASADIGKAIGSITPRAGLELAALHSSFLEEKQLGRLMTGPRNLIILFGREKARIPCDSTISTVERSLVETKRLGIIDGMLVRVVER